MDIEIFKYKTLKRANKLAKLPSEREHVTLFMRRFKKFKIKRYDLKKNISKYRLTIDYAKDFNLFKKIVQYFGKKVKFVKMSDLITYLSENPRLIKYQKKIIRNYSLKKDISKES